MCRSVLGKTEQAVDVNVISQPSKPQKASKASWSCSEAQGSSFTQAITHIHTVLDARQTCPAFGANIEQDVLVNMLCRPHQMETLGYCSQACIAALDSPGLLVQVLNHLGCIQAVALCSMVNRSWQAASQQVQLHSVTMIPENEALSSVRDLKICKKLGAQGMFDHLQSINICAIQFSQEQVRRYSYIQSLLTIMSAPICKGISTSMLTSCQLSGMFHLISVVKSLPVGLQHLVLEPDHSNSKYSAINLSILTKFACLQTLEIDIQHFEVSKLCPSEFILDGPLPSLKSLYMLHHGRLLRDPAFTLSACLPSLRHVGAVVHLDCAQAFLDLPELEFAAFSLNRSISRVCKCNAAQLTVSKSSKLSCLVL